MLCEMSFIASAKDNNSECPTTAIYLSPRQSKRGQIVVESKSPAGLEGALISSLLPPVGRRAGGDLHGLRRRTLRAGRAVLAQRRRRPVQAPTADRRRLGGRRFHRGGGLLPAAGQRRRGGRTETAGRAHERGAQRRRAEQPAPAGTSPAGQRARTGHRRPGRGRRGSQRRGGVT